MIGQSVTSEHEFFGSSDRGRQDVWETRDPYEEDVVDFDEADEDPEEDEDDDELDDDDDDDEEDEEVEDYGEEDDEVEN
jgi:hypothetical protein